jgi:hypothetical protein
MNNPEKQAILVTGRRQTKQSKKHSTQTKKMSKMHSFLLNLFSNQDKTENNFYEKKHGIML